MKTLYFALLIVCGLSLSPTIGAEPVADKKIGVVLLHGKGGLPQSLSATAAALRDVGIIVEVPEMPWSRNRIYEKSYDESMEEIDSAVKRLQSQGALRIVVGGVSMGANAALGFGTRREGLAGLVLLAPGHVPGLKGFRSKMAGSVRRAKMLVAQGKGNEKAEFGDLNQGQTKSVLTTAEIYLSWFAPDGPAVWAKNAANFKSSSPIFCGDGSKEQFPRCPYVKRNLPPGKKMTQSRVKAGHKGVAKAVTKALLAWLRNL